MGRGVGGGLKSREGSRKLLPFLIAIKLDNLKCKLYISTSNNPIHLFQVFTGNIMENEKDLSESVHSKVLDCIITDLGQIYIQLRQAESAAHNMLKISLTILVFPLIATAAIMTTEQIHNQIFNNSFSLFNLPEVLAGLVLVTGFLNFLPLYYMIEYHQTEIYCKRAINNLRGLYIECLKKEPFKDMIKEWKHDEAALKTDSKFPRIVRVFGSLTMTVVLFSAFNALYVAWALVSLGGGGKPIFIFAFGVVFLLPIIFYTIYGLFVEGKIKT
ncbi:hypothetical protein KJ039_05645 [bacterium]|nr:hypothetical protein [bacterium]